MSKSASSLAVRLPIALMVLMSAIGPFAMISIVPLIPKIGATFAVDYGTAQLTLSVYFAFFAVAQLALGPISDRVGRRPVMIAAMVLFLLGSLACAASPLLGLVLLGRGLQAFGAAAGVVITRAILFDVYGRERSASLIGYLNMAMVIGPMLAPTVAGVFATTIGWQYLFWLKSAVALLAVFWLWRSLPETRWIGGATGTRSQGFFDGLPLLKNPVFLSYAGNWAFSVAIYYSFLAGAAYIIIEQMGRSEAEYGAYFIGAAFSFMAGNFLSARFARNIGLIRFIRIGTVLACASALSLWFMQGMMHPFFVFLPMIGVAFSNGLVTPNAAASVMAVVPRLAGAASGLAGFIQITLGAVVTLLVGFFQNDSIYAMATMMTVSSLIAVIIVMTGRFHLDRP